MSRLNHWKRLLQETVNSFVFVQRAHKPQTYLTYTCWLFSLQPSLFIFPLNSLCLPPPPLPHLPAIHLFAPLVHFALTLQSSSSLPQPGRGGGPAHSWQGKDADVMAAKGLDGVRNLSGPRRCSQVHRRNICRADDGKVILPRFNHGRAPPSYPCQKGPVLRCY